MYELTPEAAAHWAGVIDRAEPLVKAEPASRPCDYGPWEKGLLELGKLEADWPNVGRYTYGIGVGGLMEFANFVVAADPPHLVARSSEVSKDNLIKLNAWRMIMYLKRAET